MGHHLYYSTQSSPPHHQIPILVPISAGSVAWKFLNTPRIGRASVPGISLLEKGTLRPRREPQTQKSAEGSEANDGGGTFYLRTLYLLVLLVLLPLLSLLLSNLCLLHILLLLTYSLLTPFRLLSLLSPLSPLRFSNVAASLSLLCCVALLKLVSTFFGICTDCVLLRYTWLCKSLPVPVAIRKRRKKWRNEGRARQNPRTLPKENQQRPPQLTTTLGNRRLTN